MKDKIILNTCQNIEECRKLFIKTMVKNFQQGEKQRIWFHSPTFYPPMFFYSVIGLILGVGPLGLFSGLITRKEIKSIKEQYSEALINKINDKIFFDGEYRKDFNDSFIRIEKRCNSGSPFLLIIEDLSYYSTPADEILGKLHVLQEQYEIEIIAGFSEKEVKNDIILEETREWVKFLPDSLGLITEIFQPDYISKRKTFIK